MSAYRTKSGARLTDEDIEHLAEAAKWGDYPGVPGAFVVAPLDVRASRKRNW